MAKKNVAKIFQNGRSQAVRLPKEFRFEGKADGFVSDWPSSYWEVYC
jgi:hypothetical protein